MTLQNSYIAYNGQITSNIRDVFDPLNRSFRLGDGFFESIRVVGGEPCFWNAHYSRLKSACEVMGMEMPVYMESAFLRNTALEVLSKSNILGGGRLRLTVYRRGGGTYFPRDLRASYLMEATEFYPKTYAVSDEGLTIGVYRHGTRRQEVFSRFKVLGNHLSIRAAAWAQENRLDEAVLLNDRGGIAETTSGNLFVHSKGELQTPPLSEGGVGGVMRMATINAALELKVPVWEHTLSEEDVLNADEVFVTNAVKGIVWVRGFEHKRYYHKLSDRMVAAVARLAAETG